VSAKTPAGDGSLAGALLFADGFESPTWSEELVHGTEAYWSIEASGPLPLALPHGGTGLGCFNAFFAAEGSQARIFKVDGIDLPALPHVVLTYWTYHSPEWSDADDRVQVQVSTGGAPWVDVGPPASRYSAESPWLWAQESVDLSMYSGSPNVRIGYLGTAGYGEDVYIDDVSVKVDASAPTVTIESPSDGWTTNSSTMDVVVSAMDDVAVRSVSVGDATLAIGRDGKYHGTVQLNEGANSLLVVARDAVGNSARATATVHLDTLAPQLVVTSPDEGARVAESSVLVTGRVLDASDVMVFVNYGQVVVQADGTFSTMADLTEGANAIEVAAIDVVWNSTREIRNVWANTKPPALSITEPADGWSTAEPAVMVRGVVTPGDPNDTVVVTVDGTPASVDAKGAFSAAVMLPEGTKTIAISATDGYGLATARSLTVTRAAGAGQAILFADGFEQGRWSWEPVVSSKKKDPPT
jgi:hypothetical protein